MDVDNYPTIPDFNGKHYKNIWMAGEHHYWDKVIARAFYDWYMEWSDGSLQRLYDYLCLTKTTESEVLVDGIDVLLVKLSVDPQFTRRNVDPPIKQVVKGVEIIIERPQKILTSQGYSIVFDCGIAFANALLWRHLNLHYGIIQTKRKIPDAFEGLPVVMGFPKKQHFYPPLIALNSVQSYLDGKRRTIVDVYQRWDAKAAQ